MKVLSEPTLVLIIFPAFVCTGKFLKFIMLGPVLSENHVFISSLMNCSSRVTSINISDDSSLLATGFSDSVIKTWTLLPHKLKKLKNADALKDINR